MAKGSKGRRGRQCRLSPYPLPSYNHEISKNFRSQKTTNPTDKKEWEDITCSVCMECPHNAVLLLCSSHDKGCRPYMCGTSFRYSNCLDQYKKAAHTKATSTSPIDNPIHVSDSGWPVENCEATELTCPLCRGQVKGWTVVDPAREYLNSKKRSCMQDNCSFIGTFRELRKHMKTAHPSARPREVDSILEQKWRRLEREREHDDVISTIRSTMPGAMVFGDYVIEGGSYGIDSDYEDNEGLDGDVGFDRNIMNVFLLLHAFGPRQPESAGGAHGSVGGMDSEDEDSDLSLVGRLSRHGRVLLGRSGRRRRHREEGGGGQRRS